MAQILASTWLKYSLTFTGKVTVTEGIGSAAGLDGCQHIIGIGVLCRQCQSRVGSSCRCRHAVHAVVGVVGAGGIRILRVLDPFQHVGIGVVVIGSGLAGGIRRRNHAVAVAGIGCCGFDGGTAANRCACVITVSGKSLRPKTDAG